LAVQPELPGDKLLFIASSAVGCVGLSQDPIAMTSTGLFTLSLAMFAGRFAPLVVLWWCARTAPGSDVAIG
jgi:Trk-type K+ transport system membrane component